MRPTVKWRRAGKWAAGLGGPAASLAVRAVDPQPPLLALSTASLLLQHFFRCNMHSLESNRTCRLPTCCLQHMHKGQWQTPCIPLESERAMKVRGP